MRIEESRDPAVFLPDVHCGGNEQPYRVSRHTGIDARVSEVVGLPQPGQLSLADSSVCGRRKPRVSVLRARQRLVLWFARLLMAARKLDALDTFTLGVDGQNQGRTENPDSEKVVDGARLSSDRIF